MYAGYSGRCHSCSVWCFFMCICVNSYSVLCKSFVGVFCLVSVCVYLVLCGDQVPMSLQKKNNNNNLFGSSGKV